MKSAPKADRREDGAPKGATIIPFRLRADRNLSEAAEAKAPKVRIVDAADDNKPKRGKKTANGELGKAERATILIPRYRDWLKQAAIASVILHVIGFAFFQTRFISDVERAANAGGMTATEGVVIDIQIVAEADSKLAPSKSPTNMTVPDAKTKSAQTPREEQKEQQKEMQKAQPLPAPNNAPQAALPQEEQAPPQKIETAPAPQSPNQQKTEDLQKPDAQEIQKQKALEQKKKQEKAAPSAAAAPTKFASLPKNQGQSGANNSTYNAQVIAHLRRFQVYPEAARSVGIKGSSTVSFTLAANGAVVAVSLVRGSGAAVLDQAALAMVRRASPFPPIPADYTNRNFTAPVLFEMR